MPLTFLTFCKICRIQNPKHGGFAGPPLDSLNKEEQARFTAKLMEHVRQQHPEILGQNVAQSSMLLHFLNLCLYDFSDQSAVKARDNLRYELAKVDASVSIVGREDRREGKRRSPERWRRCSTWQNADNRTFQISARSTGRNRGMVPGGTASTGRVFTDEIEVWYRF